MDLINKKTVIIILSALFCACKSYRVYEVPPAVRAYNGKGIIPPPGMVYVPTGTLFEKNDVTKLEDGDSSAKKISLSPFFIDATEVSNKQYRRFVDWVADSIAITTYLKNDSDYFYVIKAKNAVENAPVTTIDSAMRRINWARVDINSKIPFWQNNSKNFPGLVKVINGRKTLNRDMVKFAFAHVQADGINNSKMVTDTVPILPDDKVWTKDFPNSQSEFLVSNYFLAKGFDNYPVVGVTWKQARAYAAWRTLIADAQDKYMADMGLTFSLPTEAQWQYAALAGENNNGKNHAENNEPRYDITKTIPVKAYAPNGLGIYNMRGNVAEWALDAYSPSASVLVDDMDPVLLLDVADDDADMMKRKVVIGSSWKDNITTFNTNTPRNYEIQNAAHSYIGFRCTMIAPGILTKHFETQNYVAPKKNKMNLIVKAK